MSFLRYAVFYVPGDGDFARLGASWLGWDIGLGRDVSQPQRVGLTDITRTPRKYGFHGTLKPPFRLAQSKTEDELRAAVQRAAATCAPGVCDGLALQRLGRFLALVPIDDAEGLRRVAAKCVRDLDEFRAPLTPEEEERRRKPHLNARHIELLQAWGYPYVLDQFRFHLTLTSRLPKTEIEAWTMIAEAHFHPLPKPFAIDEISLCGEQADGQFTEIRRYPLLG